MSDSYRDKLASIGFSGLRQVDPKDLKVKLVNKPGRRNGTMGSIIVSTGDRIEERDLSQMAVEISAQKAKEAAQRTSKILLWDDGKERYLERKE